MNRRNFIKVMGTGAVVLAAGPVVVSQMSGAASAALRPTHTYTDIRKTLLSYAMLCPNPHNIQPWKVALEGKDTILLFVDSDRLLPQTDPIHRQIHIGQGTFIESLAIAATHFGVRANVHYFPRGEYSHQALEDKPVAAITLQRDESITPDPLFPYLLTRQSNKTEYTHELLSDIELSQIINTATGSDYSIEMVQSDSDKAAMRGFLNQAMFIEEQNADRSMETINMFRFNDKEYVQHRDGFGLAQNGVTGAKRWLAETFFVTRSAAESDPARFGKEGIKLTEAVTKSTQHFALLVSKNNTRKTQVEIGRLYNRINLLTASLGIAQHPMSQILQEYKDMLPLQQEFKQYFNVPETDTVQMVFRLGKAKPTPESPRREVRDLLI
ncbi:twin-arginine translocation pathway signal protein [Enterovibrio sp. ZSDZ42]|uniref:Twin-arginine translocation pathway signal protein n=1 Tax=Enterovibrio gelatinilyticus TaxID=2899819 RepID=A0ABT5R333_9GAMM|nr:twin-arginine translocation pathway signal protein [Enterovibrio sp. ZSDZ42]MDD1793917.1 twin-arginine translocation pathway signal protein [Enterovibrio sp. ZSDZ42]